MANIDDGDIKPKATSGPGWKRLADGDYLWQRHRWAPTKILSEETFEAVGKVRVFEIVFAAITLAPVAPMAAFSLEGRLRLTTFAVILLCLIIPNIIVNRYVVRRLRLLTQNAAQAKHPTPHFWLNPLRTMSDRILKFAVILLSFYGVVSLLGLISLIVGTNLPPPPPAFNVYTGTGMLALVSTALYAVVQERWRRKRET